MPETLTVTPAGLVAGAGTAMRPATLEGAAFNSGVEAVTAEVPAETVPVVVADR